MNPDELTTLAAVAKPGDTVMLRVLGDLTDHDREWLREVIDAATKRTGVHFVMLAEDVEVVPASSEQVARIDEAVRTMAAWMVQAQTGFGVQDMRGIEQILDGKREVPA